MYGRQARKRQGPRHDPLLPLRPRRALLGPCMCPACRLLPPAPTLTNKQQQQQQSCGAAQPIKSDNRNRPTVLDETTGSPVVSPQHTWLGMPFDAGMCVPHCPQGRPTCHACVLALHGTHTCTPHACHMHTVCTASFQTTGSQCHGMPVCMYVECSGSWHTHVRITESGKNDVVQGCR
jgi:hypothetical protein